MSVGRMLKWSLRQEPAELLRLARSFGLSLATHGLVFLLWLLLVTAQKHHLFDQVHLPKWLQAPKLLAQLLPKPQPPPPPPLQLQEPPLVFVEVTPSQATAEPPKDAKFYSDRNSLAANPNADQETGVPKIDGQQNQVVRTEDVARPKPAPLQPAPVPAVEPEPKKPAPAPQKPAEAQKPVEPKKPVEPAPKKPVKPAPQKVVEAKPKPAQPPGDLAMAKPQPKVQPRIEQSAESKAAEGEPPKPRPRPRTLEEARARQRQQESRIPGQKMKQEGGVRRRLDFAALDAKATPFGAYDRALVDAICQRWYALLDQRGYASDDRGKVVVSFVLHPDGRVSDMKVADNSAGDLLGYLCQQAIQDPAPFAPWPSDMRRMVGETRPIQFTFYYN